MNTTDTQSPTCFGFLEHHHKGKAALMMELKKCRSPDDGTQAVPKHVGDCVPIVFICQCM